MAQADKINADLSTELAYKFNTDQEEPVGYIFKMNFPNGGEPLTPDINIKNPENPDEMITVVGVLEYINWKGGPIDPIVFRGRLSDKNRALFKTNIHSSKVGPEVEVTWSVMYYNTSQGKYYITFGSSEDIKFSITKDYIPDVSDISAQDIKKPVNFKFNISLTPSLPAGAKAQEVNYAASPDHKLAYPIGVQA